MSCCKFGKFPYKSLYSFVHAWCHCFADNTPILNPADELWSVNCFCERGKHPSTPQLFELRNKSVMSHCCFSFLIPFLVLMLWCFPLMWLKEWKNDNYNRKYALHFCILGPTWRKVSQNQSYMSLCCVWSLPSLKPGSWDQTWRQFCLNSTLTH